MPVRPRHSTSLMFLLAFPLAVMAGCASAPPAAPPSEEKQFTTMWDEIYTKLKPEIEHGNISAEHGHTIPSPPAAQEAPAPSPQSPAAKKDTNAPFPALPLGTSPPAPPEASGTQKPQGTSFIKIRFTDRILFDSGDDQIKADGIDILSRLGGTLKDEQNINIVIQGHTDNVLIRERLRVRFSDNMALSKSRAANTAKALQRSGVPPDSIRQEWFGESRPISDNDSEEGRRKNRRVEILITPR